MGVLVRKHDGAWWGPRNPDQPVKVVEVRHSGLVVGEKGNA